MHAGTRTAAKWKTAIWAESGGQYELSWAVGVGQQWGRGLRAEKDLTRTYENVLIKPII